MTGIGPVAVRQPRVRDREAAADDAERIRFTPAILPPYARRSQSLEVLIPILYLKGISTGDFEEALAALLGKDAPGLSASTIARLKEVWIDEHEHWRKRDLSAKRYVYVWADGIYLQARLEDEAQCILVIIGATPEGKKELLGFTDGARESAQDWRELLLDLKSRGSGDRAGARRRRRRARLLEGARRAVADNTRATLLGAQDRQRPQQAAEEPAAEGQAGVAGDLDGRDEARMPRPRSTPSSKAYQLKYEKAAECLAKDRDALLAFYDFPAEHWKHLRTSNPIESTFATVRHRTIRSKGCLSNKTALAMVFKLVDAAQKSWRRLDGHNQLPKLIQGVRFTDGIEVVAKPASSSPNRRRLIPQAVTKIRR